MAIQPNRGLSDSRLPEVIIGVDIGGTGTRILVMTPERNILARKTVNTPKCFADSTAVDFLTDHIQDVAAGLRPIAIGISASGPIDTNGIIQNPDTVPGFTGVRLQEGLTKQFAVPVAVDNDAVCAALAEHSIGAGRQCDSLLHITLGTGIGVAFLLKGIPVRSGDGQHPEAGHICVAEDTDPCYCGRRSCWEQAASRQALQRIASGILSLPPTDRSAISELATLADAGDLRAVHAFNHYGASVADGLSTLLAIYRPRTVVLGGSGAEYSAFFDESLADALAVLGDWISSPTIVKTELDDYGGAIGGAILAQETAASVRYSM